LNKKTSILEKADIDLVFKNSMIQEGWIYRDSFPHFFKEGKTGRAPKSCTFSPDRAYIYVTLLNQQGHGVDIFDFSSMKKIKTLKPHCPEPENNIGYSEGTFNPNDGSFWFTRMTTANFFLYKEDNLIEYDSEGSWPKVISFDPDFKKIAISNWVSNTITIFDVSTGKHLYTNNTGNAPRGIAWLDLKTFAVALFGDGRIQIFKTDIDEPVFTINYEGYATRDIIYDDINSLLYFSDMGRNRVYKYDLENKSLISSLVVDSKPNSIRLTPDGKYLFVSCRGPNNPDGYVLKSPRNGNRLLIRTSDFSELHSWSGGNQPTGLDISPDGKYLSATDFQESRLILYRIGK